MVKTEIPYSRKREVSFPRLFHWKTPFRFCFRFRIKNSTSTSILQISVSVFIFPLRFHFSLEIRKVSIPFSSLVLWIIPSENCICGACTSYRISGLVVNVIDLAFFKYPFSSEEIFRLYFFSVGDEIEFYSYISFLFGSHYISE